MPKDVQRGVCIQIQLKTHIKSVSSSFCVLTNLMAGGING